MHIINKVTNYSRLFWSSEAYWEIAQLPINLNVDQSINEAPNIIIVTKEDVLTNLTALSPTKCILSIK